MRIELSKFIYKIVINPPPSLSGNRCGTYSSNGHVALTNVVTID